MNANLLKISPFVPLFLFSYPFPPVFTEKRRGTGLLNGGLTRKGTRDTIILSIESSSDEVEGRSLSVPPEETDGAIPRSPASGESFRCQVPSMDETLESTAPGGRRRSNAFRSTYRGYTGAMFCRPYILFCFLFYCDSFPPSREHSLFLQERQLETAVFFAPLFWPWTGEKTGQRSCPKDPAMLH